MSFNTDLEMAYHIGYDDALAKRKPDASKVHVFGRGTCISDETDTWECVCDGIGRYGKRVTIHVMECSECGHTYEHVNGDYEFCPHCGRRIEVDDG
jgi:hypothetical protein